MIISGNLQNPLRMQFWCILYLNNLVISIPPGYLHPLWYLLPPDCYFFDLWWTLFSITSHSSHPSLSLSTFPLDFPGSRHSSMISHFSFQVTIISKSYPPSSTPPWLCPCPPWGLPDLSHTTPWFRLEDSSHLFVSSLCVLLVFLLHSEYLFYSLKSLSLPLTLKASFEYFHKMSYHVDSWKQNQGSSFSLHNVSVFIFSFSNTKFLISNKKFININNFLFIFMDFCQISQLLRN